MLYLLILAFLLFLSFQYDMMEAKVNKNFWYVFMLVVFILTAGLRYRLGLDTPNYIYGFYHIYPPIEKFSFEDYPIGNDPLWVLFNSLVKSCGGRFYHLQLIHAAFVNILVFKYIKKHSSYIFTCLFFYAICCYTNYSMQIMRGSISIVICLFANDYILEKKWLKGYLLYIIALFCHAQTILLFIMPFLLSLRLNIKGVVFLVVAYILGIVILNIVGDYLFLLEASEDMSNKVDRYANSDKYGEMNDNFKSWFVRFLYDFIYSLAALWYIKYRVQSNKILRLEPIIMVGLGVLMIQANFQIFFRYVDYFRIYFVLLYSEFFFVFSKNVFKMSKGIAYIVMFLLFVPYFFLVGYSRKNAFEQYYPYSSIFEKENNAKRELFYRIQDRPGPKEDEF